MLLWWYPDPKSWLLKVSYLVPCCEICSLNLDKDSSFQTQTTVRDHELGWVLWILGITNCPNELLIISIVHCPCPLSSYVFCVCVWAEVLPGIDAYLMYWWNSHCCPWLPGSHPICCKKNKLGVTFDCAISWHVYSCLDMFIHGLHTEDWCSFTGMENCFKA